MPAAVTYDRDAAMGVLPAVPGEVLLAAVMGSHAFGLATPRSDVDVRGVFRLPTREILSLRKHASAYTSTAPDSSFHEVGRYLAMVLSGNPTLVELLFNDDRLVLHQSAVPLVEARHRLLSEGLRDKYAGYAVNQRLRLERSRPGQPLDERDQKWARHMLRLVRQGRELLTTGDLTVRVDDPEELFAFARLPREKMLAQFDAELRALDRAPSVLPERPDWDMADELLWELRGV